MNREVISVLQLNDVESSVSITNFDQLAHGYLLNCQIEAKSPNTIAIYKIVLTKFPWYYKQNGLPTEPHQLNGNHIRGFLAYLSSMTDG